MHTNDTCRLRGLGFNPVDDGQLGPDADVWPGEQTRRLDDRYRSWRQDRYREVADTALPDRRTGVQSRAPAIPPEYRGNE